MSALWCDFFRKKIIRSTADWQMYPIPSKENFKKSTVKFKSVSREFIQKIEKKSFLKILYQNNRQIIRNFLVALYFFCDARLSFCKVNLNYIYSSRPVVGIWREQVCVLLSPAVHCPISGGQEGRTSRAFPLKILFRRKYQKWLISLSSFLQN